MVAVLGLIGVGAQPEVTSAAYVPTIVGLLLGYMILSALIGRLQQWRSPSAAAENAEAQSAARRKFLGWTILVGCCGRSSGDHRPAARQRVDSGQHGTREAEAADSWRTYGRAAAGCRLPDRGPDPLRDSE